jgi:thiol-disulfide isomerase/thioredoxin
MSDPRPPPPSSLPLALVVLVNIALGALGIAWSAALFRREISGPALQIVQRHIALPVLYDLLMAMAIGVALLALAALRRQSPAGRGHWQPSALVERGAPWWYGYALVTLLSRAVFLVVFVLSWSDRRAWPQWLDYLPYHPFSSSASHSSAGFYTGLGLAVAGALVGRWWLHSGRAGLVRTVWIGAALLLLASLPAAQRQFDGRSVMAAGDDMVAALPPITRLGGGVSVPAALRDRVTVIEFWTTWCGACKRLFPRLITLRNQYKDDQRLAFLLVDIAPQEAEGKVTPALHRRVEQVVAAKGARLPVVLDDGAWSRRFGVTVFPTVGVVGPDGRLVAVWSGSPPSGALETVVREQILALQ